MTLGKEERLRGKRKFSNLFENGHSFLQTPYKVFWIKIAEDCPYPVQFAVSVSKRRFKRAVKRNLLKRRTREVFRKNKKLLDAAVIEGEQIQMIVIYNSSEILSSKDLNDAMIQILQHISNQYVEPA